MCSVTHSRKDQAAHNRPTSVNVSGNGSMAKSDQHSEQETQRRMGAILRGVFSGPPTPLKDIPKKNGESRASKAGNASGANAKTAERRS
jgi:hypothetical protein